MFCTFPSVSPHLFSSSSTKRLNSCLAVRAERWCRLRGNLFFYFKSADRGSQPAGLLVLENIRVKLDNSDIDGTFGLIILSGQTKIQHLRSYTKEERDSWKTALEEASYFTTRARLESLKNHIAKRREAEPLVKPSLGGERSLTDPNETALVSCRFSCESPSDSRGQPVSLRSVIRTFSFLHLNFLSSQIGHTGSQPGGGSVGTYRVDRV